MAEELVNFLSIPYIRPREFLSCDDYPIKSNLKNVMNFINIIHKDDKRKNGEDYISHHLYPVGSLVSKFGLSDTFVKVALLHDAIEDHANEVEEYFSESQLHRFKQEGIELNLSANRWGISNKFPDRSVAHNLFIMANEFGESSEEATMVYEML